MGCGSFAYHLNYISCTRAQPGAAAWLISPMARARGTPRGGTSGLQWYGMVWYGMVWYGMVWYGMDRMVYGMVGGGKGLMGKGWEGVVPPCHSPACRMCHHRLHLRRIGWSAVSRLVGRLVGKRDEKGGGGIRAGGWVLAYLFTCRCCHRQICHSVKGAVKLECGSGAHANAQREEGG